MISVKLGSVFSRAETTSTMLPSFPLEVFPVYIESTSHRESRLPPQPLVQPGSIISISHVSASTHFPPQSAVGFPGTRAPCVQRFLYHSVRCLHLVLLKSTAARAVPLSRGTQRRPCKHSMCVEMVPGPPHPEPLLLLYHATISALHATPIQCSNQYATHYAQRGILSRTWPDW